MDELPQWREQDSAAFVSCGEMFVPQREAVFDAISALVPIISPCRILELGCGAGDLAARLLTDHPEAELTALDVSPTMLGAAQQRLAPFGARAHVVQADLAADDWRSARGLQLIVSSLAVHHLDHDAKQRLLRDCALMLADGGVFVLFDVVLHRRDAVRLVAARDWDAEVAARSRRIAGNDVPLQFFRDDGWNMYASGEIDPVDRPAPVRDLLNWLGDAGFHDADLVRQFAGHALIAAYR